MEKFEKLDNEQKELVKYLIEKFCEAPCSMTKTPFIEKYLTPEPVIEVFFWYKGLLNEGLVFVESILNKEDGKTRVRGYGFDKKGVWKFDNTFGLSHSVIKATPEEVEARLIEEAKKRGFIEGARTKGVIGEEARTINGKFFSNNPFESLCATTSGIYGKQIFGNGKWAEIIDEKAELRETIEKLRVELSTLESQL